MSGPNILPDSNNKLHRRLPLAATAAGLAISLIGCASGKETVKNGLTLVPSAAPSAMSTHNATPNPTASPSQKQLALTPDMSGFLKPGSETTCFNGGARPCAILLRTKPMLAGERINADPAESSVTWPLESYAGKPGDKLVVECYTPNGQVMKPYEGNSSSTDWYEVMIPEAHIVNPTVEAELNQSGSSVKTINYDGHVAILGWASLEWFNQTVPATGVSRC
jgi:hypothetical protein